MDFLENPHANEGIAQNVYDGLFSKAVDSGRFVSVLDSLPAHIAILDQTGTIITVNSAWRAFAEANGAVPERVSEGANYLSVCDSAQGASSAGAASFAAGIRRVIAGSQERYVAEYPCHSPREKRWFEGSVTRFCGTGTPYIVITHEEITERKQIAKTLRESEEQYRLLFEHNPCPMWVYHLDTLAFLAVNNAAIDHYGYSRSEFLGMTIKDLRPLEEIPALLEDVRLARLGHNKTGIWRHRKKDDSLIEVEITAQTLHSTNDRTRLVLALDVTERRQAEMALRDAQERIEGIISSAMDAIITVDTNQRLLLFNTAAEKMFGYSAQEVLGQPLDRFIPERFRSAHQNHIPGFAQTQVTKRRMGDLGAIFGVRANGEEFPIEASISQIEAGGARIFTVILRDITKRKRAEDDLRSLAAIVESSADAIMGITLETVLTSWNKGAEKVFGYTAEEAVGQSLRMLIPAERKEEEHQILEKLKRGERVEHYETERVRKGGERINVSLTVSPIRDNTGRIIGASKIARDITGRKRAEEALRKSQEQIADILNSAMDAIITIDVKQNIVLFNVAAEKMFGYLSGQVLNQPFDRFIPERFRPVIHKHILSVEQNNDAHQRMGELGAIFGLRASGEEFPIEVSISHINTGDERLYTVILRDISARKHAEQELIRSEERYRRLFETAPDIIYTLSANDGAITTINPASETITGWQKSELIGKHFTALIHPDDRKSVENIFQKVRRGEKPTPYELRIPSKSGDWIVAEFVSIPQIEGGKVTELLGIARNITQRKMAEKKIRQLNEELEHRVTERTAQLAAANQELESFSYSVSHDLRAPLRAIAGFSRILREEHDEDLPVEARQHLQRIQENAQQMGRLIDDLLALSRLGRHGLNKQMVEPASIVRKVFAQLFDEQAGRPVEIAIGDLPPCLADPALLKQVLVNLLSNALKFTRQKDAAVIEIGHYNKSNPMEAPIYFIKDNGAGFDMRYVDKLFGVFQRLHRAEEYEGTGVGLAIVQRIIHRHGGRIWAEAEVGKGATFYFTLRGESNE